MRLIRWAECASVHVCDCVCVCRAVCVACLPCCVQLKTNFDSPQPQPHPLFNPGDVASRFALQFQASISAFFYDKLHLATTDALHWRWHYNQPTPQHTPHTLHSMSIATPPPSLSLLRVSDWTGSRGRVWEWVRHGSAYVCVCTCVTTSPHVTVVLVVISVGIWSL